MTMAKQTTKDLERAAELATQLEALLQHTYGNSAEAFQSMNDQLQDAYLWVCADLAAQLRKCLISQ